MNQNEKQVIVDLVSVLETRTIHFNQIFTQTYIQEVIATLDKVVAYDTLVGAEKYIQLTIDSPGGAVFSLFSLLEKIESMKTKGYTVHTHTSSLAASCGFILYISGNHRTISQFGYLMNHQSSGMTGGTMRDMEISLELQKKMDQQINQYIKANTDLSDEEINKPYLTNSDVWYTSQDALELKLAHEVVNY